jgi:hypothetical protein
MKMPQANGVFIARAECACLKPKEFKLVPMVNF